MPPHLRSRLWRACTQCAPYGVLTCTDVSCRLYASAELSIKRGQRRWRRHSRRCCGWRDRQGGGVLLDRVEQPVEVEGVPIHGAVCQPRDLGGQYRVPGHRRARSGAVPAPARVGRRVGGDGGQGVERRRPGAARRSVVSPGGCRRPARRPGFWRRPSPPSGESIVASCPPVVLLSTTGADSVLRGRHGPTDAADLHGARTTPAGSLLRD
jgi:hypothetical protein